MGRVATIARRTFLVGSVAIAGGAAYGVYLFNRDPGNPLKDDLKQGEAALTPYVKIDADGVTLITPRTDLGQGAYSVQAALLAEELDLAWQDIKVSPGMPSPAYYNGALGGELMGFAATDDGWLARNARTFGGGVSKVMGLQGTGGSSTVPDAYVKLRAAGASARQALLIAAAKQSGVPESKLKTENGAVVLPDGKTLTYASLAPALADIDPPQDVPLKSPDQWRYLGKKMDRVDMAGKLKGGRVFGIDRQMDGMVYATVRTNPRIGGKLNGYDDSAAKTMRGVKKIVRVPGGAAVVADNSWRAIQAANAIQFDWGAAPYPATSAEMWKNVEASFADDFENSRSRDDGDVEAAVEGGKTVEAEYRLPYLAHAALEPLNATALYGKDRLEIWTATQMPLFARDFAAREAGLDPEQVFVHVEMSGGSFGRRLEDDFIRQVAIIAKAMPGTPVKLTWSREEDMTHDFPRPMHMGRGKGAVKDGKVVTMDLSLAGLSAVESQMGRVEMSAPGPDRQLIAGAWDQPFAIPNYRVTAYKTPAMVPVSSWRSVGASANGFVHDSFLDELIHAAGADPMEERIRLCWHKPSRGVLEEVAKLSGWNGPKPAEGRARGVAFTLSFGVPVAEVVEISQTDAGIKLEKVWAVAEVGRVLDPVNFENQMMGGVVWGLGHAMNCEITYTDGQADQTNFHMFTGMRMHQCPEITVKGLETAEQIRGIGEPPVPPAAPALANAIFALTGQRIRELPLSKSVTFA